MRSLPSSNADATKGLALPSNLTDRYTCSLQCRYFSVLASRRIDRDLV